MGQLKALTRAWPVLLADERAGLRTVLRLARQRYVADGVGDVTVLEPLVALAYCGEDNLGQDDRYDYDGSGSQIRELVTAWLRGLVMAGSGPHALRQRVRDWILARDPEPHDEFAVGTLALLGPDLDDRAEAFLRGVPGGRLVPAVEAAGPVAALAAHQPALLLSLAESFYVMNPGEGAGMLDVLGGIRTHRGKTSPLAAWWYGPFFQLLCAHPADALTLINRLLDHAAAIRAGGVPPPGADTPGLDLDLPGAGIRRCVGTDETWRWYRGGTTAPFPCLSALLAVERWAGYLLLDALHVPISDVIKLLLRDCHNLAMPGLAVGLLARYPELAGNQLDIWLSRPELWSLEADRAFGEGPGTLHVQGPDPADLHGRDRRGLRFHDVAAGMTVKAMLDGNQDRLAALAAIGDELIRWAGELTTGREDTEEQMATAESWAAILHPENHHPAPAEDGGIRFEYRHPGDVAENLAGPRESLERGMTALRLQSTYTRSPIWDAPTDMLLADLAAARDLAGNPPPGPVHPADPIAAVAAAAVAAHARGRAVVPDEDLRWAADVLVEVSSQPWTDGISSAESRYSMGADRSAAAALPALLLPAFDQVRPSLGDLEGALRHAGASLPDEVRMIFARATAPIWAAPCCPAGTCRHQVLWSAAIGGLRDCQLGAWDRISQRRLTEPLGEPFDQALPAVETERLLVNRLTGPLIAAAEAARSDSCVAEQAQGVLGALLAAHRRGAAYWYEEDYVHPGDQHGPATARVLAEMAAAGDTQPLAGHVRAYIRQSPHALADLLHNLAIAFTYDDALRRALPGAWRPVVEAALEEAEADPELLADPHWSGTALAGLIAAPEPDLADADPDTTVERARAAWPEPDSFGDLVERWLPAARGWPEAVDGLVKLTRCGSAAWQASTGLEWAEELIGGRFAAVAGRCYYLVRWLGDVRAALPGEAEAVRWRRVVDGLAAAGDNRAAGLQQAEE